MGDGIWVGHGGDADVDGDGDKDCGISLLGFTSGEEMNAALKMHGSADLSLTQEKALIINKQAVIRLIRLPGEPSSPAAAPSLLTAWHSYSVAPTQPHVETFPSAQCLCATFPFSRLLRPHLPHTQTSKLE